MSVPARAPERKVKKSVSKRFHFFSLRQQLKVQKLLTTQNSGCFSKIRFTYNFQVKVGFRVSIKRLHRCYKAFERFRVSKLSPYREFQSLIVSVYIPYQKTGMALLSILGIWYGIDIYIGYKNWLETDCSTLWWPCFLSWQGKHINTQKQLFWWTTCPKHQKMCKKMHNLSVAFSSTLQKNIFLVAFFSYCFCIFNSSTGRLLWLVQTFPNKKWWIARKQRAHQPNVQ